MARDLTRRQWFRYSIDEVLGVVEQYNGRPNFKLSDLAALSRADLGRLVPAIVDASSVRAEREQVVVRRDGRLVEPLFDVGSMEADVWARIDGQTNMESMAESLASAWGEAPDPAFDRVREVILRLVRHGICLPQNPL